MTHSEALAKALGEAEQGKHSFDVDETANLSSSERLTLLLTVRRQVILERYGFEPSFERIAEIRQGGECGRQRTGFPLDQPFGG